MAGKDPTNLDFLEGRKKKHTMADMGEADGESLFSFSFSFCSENFIDPS